MKAFIKVHRWDGVALLIPVNKIISVIDHTRPKSKGAACLEVGSPRDSDGIHMYAIKETVDTIFLNMRVV